MIYGGSKPSQGTRATWPDRCESTFASNGNELGQSLGLRGAPRLPEEHPPTLGRLAVREIPDEPPPRLAGPVVSLEGPERETQPEEGIGRLVPFRRQGDRLLVAR